jgi:hypothetical protein
MFSKFCRGACSNFWLAVLPSVFQRICSGEAQSEQQLHKILVLGHHHGAGLFGRPEDGLIRPVPET